MTTTTTTTYQTLSNARQLISRGFCQNAAARDRVGRELESGHDPEAARFCLVEAVYVAAPDRAAFDGALARIAGAGGIAADSTDGLMDALTGWNDEAGRTKRQALRLLNAALLA